VQQGGSGRTSGDGRRNLERYFAAVGVHDVCAPVVFGHKAGLGDLEPVGRGARSGGCIVDLGPRTSSLIRTGFSLG
jgi:hypothetical protein